MSAKGPERPWFKATRRHGSFSALPVAWQGWASLFGFIGAIVLLGTMLLRLLIGQLGPFAVVLYLPVLGLAGWAFYRFVVTKSEITDLRE